MFWNSALGVGGACRLSPRCLQITGPTSKEMAQFNLIVNLLGWWWNMDHRWSENYARIGFVLGHTHHRLVFAPCKRRERRGFVGHQLHVTPWHESWCSDDGCQLPRTSNWTLGQVLDKLISHGLCIFRPRGHDLLELKEGYSDPNWRLTRDTCLDHGYLMFNNKLFFWEKRGFIKLQIGRASCRERVYVLV